MAHRDKFGRTTFGRKYARQDASIEAPPALPITLPLKIRRDQERFAIEDGSGRAVCHLYFDDGEGGRQERFSEAEAGQMARMIARLLTDVEAEK